MRTENKQNPYWQQSVTSPSFPVLESDVNVDVVIVGGGIAGLTAAYELMQAGRSVAVVEKNQLSSGTSGSTTGKVSSQHGLVYAELLKRQGKKAAKTYADVNQAALQKISALVKKQSIDCNWQVADSYVYTVDPGKVAEFKSEAKVAKSLGLPASFETQTELPFDVKAAVRFKNQASMNVKKYVLGLAKLVTDGGGQIFEQSNVTHIHDGHHAKVTTKHGSVTAKAIILATKIPPSPLVARLLCAAYEHPETSYIVAGNPRIPLKNMYISPDKGHYSLLQVETPDGPLLLVGGEPHTPGISPSNRHYKKLVEYAHTHFGVDKIEYRWKAMDYLAYDNVPLIGKVYPWSKNLYIASGFKKWGLTTSMVAAEILRDLITDNRNDSAELFNSLRMSAPLSAPHTIKTKLLKNLERRKA